MSTQTTTETKRFLHVPEQNEFYSLWPNPFDFIVADRPTQPGEKPQWQTETRHPITPRLFQQGHFLIGVRPGRQTNYLMIDIDAGSRFHPRYNPGAIDRLHDILEPLGLVESILVRSSDSGGLHIYFPIAEPIRSYLLADVVSVLLQSNGFLLLPGQLEIFPNPRLYSDGEPVLFAAHRIPFQEPGSYLVDRQMNPIFSLSLNDRDAFVKHWKFAQRRNELNEESIRQRLKFLKRGKHKCLSSKAEKFLGDLQAEVEAGWSDYHQTNFLLGRVALLEYVFHHVLHGGEPLSGEALVQAIVAKAKSLPGYEEYCRHQHEIEERAREWARSVERCQRYYPYGYSDGFVGKSEARDEPSWNERQAQSARERITAAIADLLNQEKLPAGITERRKAIAAYGISQSTLSKYKDLWHPDHLVKLQPEEIKESERSPESIPGGELHPSGEISLAKLAEPGPPQVDPGPALPQQGGCGGNSTGEKEDLDPGLAQVDPSVAQVDPSVAPTQSEEEKGLNKGLEFARRIVEGIKRRLEEMKKALPLPEPIDSAGEEYFGSIEPKPMVEELVVSGVPEPIDSVGLGEDHLGQIEPEPVVKEPIDLGEVLAEISIEKMMRGWNAAKLGEFVAQHFGGRSQSELGDGELVELLELLKQ